MALIDYSWTNDRSIETFLVDMSREFAGIEDLLLDLNVKTASCATDAVDAMQSHHVLGIRLSSEEVVTVLEVVNASAQIGERIISHRKIEQHSLNEALHPRARRGRWSAKATLHVMRGGGIIPLMRQRQIPPEISPRAIMSA